MRARTDFSLLAGAAVLLATLPLASAHEHGLASVGMNTAKNATWEEQNHPAAVAHGMESYFRHAQHGGWNLAHTVLMLLAWVMVMPLAIMLSVARSRYHLPAQVFFHLVNSFGVFTGLVYNHATPELYEGNAHHPLGWVVMVLTVVWTLISFYVAYGEDQGPKIASGSSLNAQRMAKYERLSQMDEEARQSRDSGHGTERHSASLYGSRQNSSDIVHQKPEEPMDDLALGDEEIDDLERRGFLGDNRLDRFLSRSVGRISTQRATKGVRFAQIVLEKFLLLLGFAALLSGFIVFGGLFRDRQIFSGLAHYIKGGIFFWYGLLTLGRWMGAFTEFGWAWNLRPQQPLVSKWKSRVPSAEFTESFVIWLYGATNVFLEHLNNWGKGWSPQDLEHISITMLFFGGGLLGMLIESSWARELMNTPVLIQKSKTDEYGQRSFTEEPNQWAEPQTYRVSTNPMPGTTIMLLGMMMGAHHQESMVSTMLHAQWGGLFTAFALARAATYILMYIKPPTSHFASRPPSELVAAFCLTSGGIIFMNSAADTVTAIEENGLDAMTIFTLTMGLTGIILAWEVMVFAIKGWAVRREQAALGNHWDKA